MKVRAIALVVAALHGLEARALADEKEEDDRAGFVVGAKAGASLLRQHGGAPPICCGERDEWIGIGPQVGVRAGWGFGEHLRLSSDLAYGFLTANDTYEHTDLTLHTVDFQIAAEAIAPFGLRGGVVGGTGLLLASATSAGGLAQDPRQARLQTLLRLGYERFIAPGFLLALELSGGLDWIGLGLPVGSAAVVGAWM